MKIRRNLRLNGQKSTKIFKNFQNLRKILKYQNFRTIIEGRISHPDRMRNLGQKLMVKMEIGFKPSLKDTITEKS